MRTDRIIIEKWVFRSDVVPGVETDSHNLAKVIQWADANPVVWKIVQGNRSKPFGRTSSTYLGCERGVDSRSILARAATLKRYTEEDETRAGREKDSIFMWRARFTIEHYEDKGFKGGFFQLWDGEYDRSCLDLDYTPETLDEVIERFLAWCDPFYKKVAVKLGGKIVRKVK